jgi:hypothetical protein
VRRLREPDAYPVVVSEQLRARQAVARAASNAPGNKTASF